MPVIDSERYEIDPKPIGRGGFGEIYKAYDHLYERNVVIKTIVASHLYGINEPAFRRQFFKEAVISARLGRETPYIVDVFDYGYDRETDLPFFVMEFVQGHDLTREIGTFSFERALLLTSNMLEALRIAHKKGVVHSDVSPDNIMYDEKEEIFKLNDFGLARLLNSTLMSRGSVKSLIGGKPGYLPLMDWQTGDRTPHSDLYALVVSVTQLVTGQIPVWKFSNGSLTPPDLATAFQSKFGTDLDAVRFTQERDQWSHSKALIFSCAPRGKRNWNFTGERVVDACDIAVEDLSTLIADVLAGDTATVDTAIEFLRQRNLAMLTYKEQAYQEQKKREADASKQKEKAAKSEPVPSDSSSESDDQSSRNP